MNQKHYILPFDPYMKGSEAETIAITLNKHFSDQVFRIKNIGPARLDRYEALSYKNDSDQFEYKLIFKSIYNKNKYHTTVAIHRLCHQPEGLVILINSLFRKVSESELSEWDHLLFKDTNTQVVVDEGPFHLNDINQFINDIKMQSGKITFISTPSGKDLLKELMGYESPIDKKFKDQFSHIWDASKYEEPIKGLEAWLDVCPPDPLPSGPKKL